MPENTTNPTEPKDAEGVESSVLLGLWKPIDSAPKDGQKIIVWDAVVDFAVWEEGRSEWSDLDGKYSDPSHWMPLPSPPNSANHLTP